jgi:glyoxylase-like metal-dependent hydrolase (beta-lactamase superfamily II)
MRTIDTQMHGRAGITGAFLVEGEKRALIETGPKSSLPAVTQGLAEAGIEDLDLILVTHIHLDHAGAAGTLAQRFPGATVVVHEVGAPHLVDPSKLWSSASRIYGDRMEEMWGGIDPIPEERILAISDGAKIELGGRTIEAIETPGHARHHHAFLDHGSGTLFTGDALGVRLPDIGVMRPATPPPEFNLEDALASIDRIAATGAERLCLTHFGSTDAGVESMSVAEACEAAKEALTTWADWVAEARLRTTDVDQATIHVRERAVEAMRGKADDASIDRMEQTTSFWMNTWGYMRYMDKKEQAGAT